MVQPGIESIYERYRTCTLIECRETVLAHLRLAFQPCSIENLLRVTQRRERLAKMLPVVAAHRQFPAVRQLD